MTTRWTPTRTPVAADSGAGDGPLLSGAPSLAKPQFGKTVWPSGLEPCCAHLPDASSNPLAHPPMGAHRARPFGHARRCPAWLWGGAVDEVHGRRGYHHR